MVEDDEVITITRVLAAFAQFEPLIASRSGRIFKSAGDGLLIEFSSVVDAVECAVEMQRRLEQSVTRPPLRMRIGIHVGDVVVVDDDLYGDGVNVAARLEPLSVPGGICLSHAAHDDVRGRLDGVDFQDGGELVVKNISRPIRCWFWPAAPTGPPAGILAQGPALGDAAPVIVAAAGESADQSVAVPTVLGNVPRPADDLIGRGDALAKLVGEVRGGKLVTITGPGGIGKTRLAIETARTAGLAFPDGVWWVELAPLAAGGAIVHAVADVLDVTPRDGSSLVDVVVESLRDRNILLVLDNCEHVLDAAADLAARVAANCSGVAVLATSRESLLAPGEHVHLLPGLDPADEAAELFDARAAAADADYRATDSNRSAVVALCERLDGIPLAIELAAARIRTLSASELLSRLDAGFDLLGGGRAVDERHRTLHATIDWSYRLLNDTERVLFERLAVFAGSCDLEAIEAVCCDPPLERDDVDSLLAALVDKSLVTAHRIGDVTRFRLLETIRQFAEERLEDSGQHRAMRAAHLMHYRNAALVAGARYGGPDERDAVARLRGDWDDIRAALDEAIGTADVASAAELVAAPFWYAWHEMRSELGHWAERALRMMTDMPAEPTPDVYGVAAAFAVNAGEMERGRDLARQGIRAAAQSGQPPPFICLLFLANSYFYAGQRAEAWEALLVCDEHTSKHGTPYEQFFVTLPLTGYSAIVSPADTPDHAARGQRLAWRLDAPTPLAIAQWEAACAAWSSGDLHPALDTFERARREAESLGATWLVGLTLSSAIIRLAGDPGDEPFTRRYLETIAHFHRTREWVHQWGALESLAIRWTRHGRMQPAAVLIGHMEAHRRANSYLVPHRAQAIDSLRAFGPAAGWMADGAALQPDQLARFALDVLETDLAAETSSVPHPRFSVDPRTSSGSLAP